MEIKSILIQNFRGIPSSLSLDLTAKGAGPTSVVILGDNGSGKSSIIDAIEFCLQGRLHRSTRIEYDDIPEAHSYFSLRDASVKVEFENGESFERDIVQVDKNRSFNSKPIKGFSKIPIALRRKDILRFWNTPKEERQKVFFDFLGAKDTNIEHISPDQIISVLKQQQIELRKNRKDAILELEKKTKIKGIPNTIRSFDKYVEKRPILIKIGKELVERIKKYNSELIKVNEEIRNLNESSKKKDCSSQTKNFLKAHCLQLMKEFLKILR